MSDALSRLPNPTITAEVELDMRVDEVSFNVINVSQKKQQTLRDETINCPMLSALSEVIFQGWPEKMRDLPRELRSFWSYRDELGIEDGVIFKGKQAFDSRMHASRYPSAAASRSSRHRKDKNAGT